MLIYFIQAFSLWISGIGRHINKSFTKKKKYMILSFIILFSVAALRKYTVGADLNGHYALRFDIIKDMSWKEVIEFRSSTGYGIGYCLYNKFVACICPNLQFFIAFTSAILIGVTLWFIYRNSIDVVLSTNIFMLYCLYYMYMTMIRQGLAVCLVIIGYECMKRYQNPILRYIIFTCFVGLATSFHSSALLCLVMIPFDFLKFDKKYVLYAMVALVFALVFYNQLYFLAVRLLPSLSNNYGRYIDHASESVGNINRQSITDVALTGLAFVMGYYGLILKKNTKVRLSALQNRIVNKRQDDFMLYMVLGALICRVLVFRMNIMYRMSYYFIPFLFLLYPRAIACFNPKNRTIVRIAIYALMGMYFVVMTLKYAQPFYQVIPFEFFWE